uniref:Uncharacterized protein n=2 Tax=Pseudoalteromonas rubra TaxID=43658 RepID=A0A0F4QST8_9GAMM|nr:hypothetical protein TW77_06955 [Pseudoalteromonas rubra]
MATVIEIVEKLRNGEEVVIHNRYQFTVMQQIEIHGEKIGALPPISFEQHDKNHTRLTLVR